MLCCVISLLPVSWRSTYSALCLFRVWCEGGHTLKGFSVPLSCARSRVVATLLEKKQFFFKSLHLQLVLNVVFNGHLGYR